MDRTFIVYHGITKAVLYHGKDFAAASAILTEPTPEIGRYTISRIIRNITTDNYSIDYDGTHRPDRFKDQDKSDPRNKLRKLNTEQDCSLPYDQLNHVYFDTSLFK